MFILGINAYHGDASACILQDGRLIAAIEEERINRIKHWAGLPIESIKYCLNEANISINDVDYVTLSKNPKAEFFKKIAFTINKPKIIKSLGNRASNGIKINNIVSHIYDHLSIDYVHEHAPELKFVEHHRSHNASSFYKSPFEESTLLSIDGMGDFTSTMFAYGKGTKINVLDKISHPNSLGYFYTAITQYLGFPNYGDEYKVMGLASYGSPNYSSELRRMIIQERDGTFKLNPKYFSFIKSGVKMHWDNGTPVIEQLFSDYLVKQNGPMRNSKEPISQFHMDMAASAQQVTEEIIFGLCEYLYNKTKSENLCLSGGVAQNSVANGKIVSNTRFTNLFVPPASNDAGTAIGSALYFSHHILGKPRVNRQNWAYTGSTFEVEEIKATLDKRAIKYSEHNQEDLFDKVVDMLAENGIVGWFQGRMEFGPRALGNRSILANPSHKDAKEVLNGKIKRRESFRPFAPSILKEEIKDYFEIEDDAMYMEKVFKIKQEKHFVIPAVTHIDGTGRLHTVDKELNPLYHKLITKFYKKTGIPLLLNTSFNENEPIVNTPDNAIDCFLKTDMDLLVMENIVVSRN